MKTFRSVANEILARTIQEEEERQSILNAYHVERIVLNAMEKGLSEEETAKLLKEAGATPRELKCFHWGYFLGESSRCVPL